MNGEAARSHNSSTPSEVALDPDSSTRPGATPGKRQSVEGLVQVVIMLAIGVAAGAGSFRHVHDVAAMHGQAGWLAWADAVVLELMSIASGLELRRRKRAHESVKFPAVVMGARRCSVARGSGGRGRAVGNRVDRGGDSGPGVSGNGEDCLGPFWCGGL